MRKEREANFDPSQPALVVTYGNTTRKHRALNGDLVVIGRSSCCDVGLVSPEVAPIHCVIVKGLDGWRIRDCTGRSGTRLNGRTIIDEPLRDGDALQIGTFSFQLNLPRTDPAGRPPSQPPAVAVAPVLPVAPSQVADNKADDAKAAHLKQSRERLARHALNLRRRLREKMAVPPPAAPVAPSRFDAELAAKRAELEQLEQKLKFWEKELTEQDRGLREEYCDLEHQRKELERFAQDSLARKQAELERKTQAILADHRHELEAQLEHTLAGRQAELDKRADSLQEREHDLDLERRQMEERVLQILVDKRGELLAAEEELKNQRAELEQKLHQAEQVNAEVEEMREALRLEFGDAERMREEAQEDLKAQVREAEEHLETLWQRCEAHRQSVEEQHGPIAAAPDNTAQVHDLAVRSRELDEYAKQLQSTRATLTQYEQELKEAYQQFHEEYENAVQEAQAVKEQAEAEAAELHRRAEQNGSAALGEHESRLADTIIAEVRQESEQLRAEMTAKLAEERERAVKAEDRSKRMQTELANLRAELTQREEILEHLQAELKERAERETPTVLNGETSLAAPERLMALVEKLQQDVIERDGQIVELQRRMQQLQKFGDLGDKDAFEAELNRYRVELEQDRAWLNQEIATLQISKAEIDETRQEEELRISHERVEIAREWAEINRIREQLRRDATKPGKPESAVRDRAKAKLTTKCEAVELTPSAPQTPPQPDLISRLVRTTRNGLGTTP